MTRFRLLLFLWLFGSISYFLPGATWQPVSRFDLVRALVEQRTVTIDSYADSTGDRAYRDGHWYSDKAPVPALWAAPFYTIFLAFERLHHQAPAFQAFAKNGLPAVKLVINGSFRRGLYCCSVVTAGAAAAGICLLLYELLRRRTSPKVALTAGVVTVLATPIFPYATSFYGHVPAGLLLLGAVTALDRDEISPLRWRIAGVCLTLAAGCEYLMGVVGGAIALTAILQTRRLRAIADLALGGALPALLIGLMHQASFGAPWRTGYSFVTLPQFSSGHRSGFFGIHPPSPHALLGLIAGSERSLFYVAPITALAVVGLAVAIFRDRDRSAIRAALGVTTLLVANAGYYMWWGGAAVAPRHFIPALGLIGLGFAQVAQWRWSKWIAVPLLAWSLFSMMLFAHAGVEAPESGSQYWSYAWPRLTGAISVPQNGQSNLGINLGLSRAASTVPLLIWLGAGFVYLWRKLPDRET